MYSLYNAWQGFHGEPAQLHHRVLSKARSSMGIRFGKRNCSGNGSEREQQPFSLENSLSQVSDVQSGVVDIIATSLTLNPNRAKAVAYLHPMGTETYALYVKRSSDDREYS